MLSKVFVKAVSILLVTTLPGLAAAQQENQGQSPVLPGEAQPEAVQPDKEPAGTAQTGGVQPRRGQSQEQLWKDKTDCYTIARQTTGYDPAQAAVPAVSSAVVQPPAGGQVQETAAGTASGTPGLGARINQYRRGRNVLSSLGDDLRENPGGPVGAGILADDPRPRPQRRQTAAVRNQIGAAQSQAKADAFTQAYSNCLTGRGYSITPR